MRARLGTSVAVVAGLVIGLGAGISPASAAAAPPVVTGIDVSVPGHVSGTLTSDQPYVLIAIGDDMPVRAVAMSDGSGTFDLETWGYAGPQTLHATACPTSAPSAECSPAQTDAVGFTPTDAQPTITWPADTTIGPGQTASITVSDPDGGGYLEAVWMAGPQTVGTMVVNRNGATDLQLQDGGTYLTVRRCATWDFAHCVDLPTPQGIGLQVRRSVTTYLRMPAPVTITTAAPSYSASVQVTPLGVGKDYSLSWHVEKNGVPVAGVGETGLTGTLDSNGDTASFEVTAGNLPDGWYDLVASVTASNPDFGTFPAVTSSGGFTVDRNAPVLTSFTASRQTIYPRVDTTGHPGSTTFTIKGQFASGDTIVVRNVEGTVVGVLWPQLSNDMTSGTAVWRGERNLLPVSAGTYTATVVDYVGNAASSSLSVVVSDKRLVRQTFTRTVAAAPSRVATYVGRCSNLRRPSSRGWAKSLGFYANTKCARKTWSASAVSTVHAIRLPAAERYVDVHIDTYGGGARSRPRSQGFTRALDTSGEWTGEDLVTAKVGLHVGQTLPLPGLVSRDGVLAWGFATAAGRRYDVRSFTIVARYDVIA